MLAEEFRVASFGCRSKKNGCPSCRSIGSAMAGDGSSCWANEDGEAHISNRCDYFPDIISWICNDCRSGL